MNKLIIATRNSKLALWQSEHIKSILEKTHGIEVELKGFKTKGDKILDTPLAKIGGKGLFTKEIEEAMLRGEAHLAVHSLKDFPIEFPDELKLCAITKREDVRDSFLSDKYSSIDELPKGAIVGTTSLRRRMQLLLHRDDLVIKDLRGNINTRIQKLKDGEFDAIILAQAGINRLELGDIVSYIKPIDTKLMIPAMGQASLAVESIDDERVLKLLEVLHDEEAYIETKIERDFITALDGGCQVPIGIHAKLDGENINISAILGYPNGEKLLKDEITCSKDEFDTIGTKLANEFIAKGAKEILKEAERLF